MIKKKEKKPRKKCSICLENKLLRYFKYDAFNKKYNDICKKCEWGIILKNDFIYKLNETNIGECKCKKCNIQLTKEEYLASKGYCRKCIKPDMRGLKNISAFWIPIKNLMYQERKKKREPDVNIEYLLDLAEKQDYKCALMGVELNKIKTDRVRDPFNPSIDRIDNSKGYEMGNIRWVCWWANVSKNQYTDEEFYDFCRSVTDFNKNKLGKKP